MFYIRFIRSLRAVLTQNLTNSVGNVAFTMPFMPQATTMHDSDISGLVVIMAGLMLYRFSASPSAEDEDSIASGADSVENERADDPPSEARGLNEVDRIEGGLREPLLHGDI